MMDWMTEMGTTELAVVAVLGLVLGGALGVARNRSADSALVLAVTLIRAYVIWALLIGQAVIIALFTVDKRLIDNSSGAWIVVAILAASGVAGLAGEWVWRRRQAKIGLDV